MCLQRELIHCSGDDVTLVQTSLKYLIEGYQVNGRCKDIIVGPPAEKEDEEKVTGKLNFQSFNNSSESTILIESANLAINQDISRPGFFLRSE